ncbi:MAG: hypothetical protein ABJO52_05785 [Nisaea sp.]|uniref:hypothetical protein n=1 Tax=Nisaea sp. TaxID=2024842 RepID=UPI003298EFDE
MPRIKLFPELQAQSHLRYSNYVSGLPILEAATVQLECGRTIFESLRIYGREFVLSRLKLAPDFPAASFPTQSGWYLLCQ